MQPNAKQSYCYSRRRPHLVPLLSDRSRNQSLQWAQVHRHWVVEDWENLAWSSSDLQRSGFNEPVPNVASDSCSCLTGTM